MQPTNIGWTDFSSNLIKYRDPDDNVVHSCVRVSEGCRNCYSATLATRWGRKGRDFTAENMKRLAPFFDEVEARRLLTSKKITGKRVFVNDMTDWMGPWISDEIIDQCMAVFATRHDVIFQTLTKHADRQRKYFQDSSLEDRITELWQADDLDRQTWNVMLPLHNLHIGVSVEDQKNADKRIPDLLETPAALRWISAEPLIDSLSLRWAKWQPWSSVNNQYDGLRRLDWIVIGGESGSGHRTMPLESALEFIRNAREAGVSIFVKQDSGPRPGMQGRIPDELWLKEFPIAA